MKKYISTILIIVIFIIGLLVMFYPSISNWYNERMHSYVVSNYVAEVESIDQETIDQTLYDAREYNTQLHTSPLEFITGEAQDSYYIETLDVYNGMMGYIVIESLDIYLPISHGTDEDVLQTGVGHLEGSSLPTGDVGNHTVLTGHTGLPSAELFTDLVDMELGDTFEVHILNTIYTYEVFNIIVVEPYEVDDLENVEGKDIVTLVTCTPYGINSHRLLVQGEQISAVEQVIEDQEENQELITDKDITKYILVIEAIIIFVLLLWAIIGAVHYQSKKRRKK